MKKITLLFAIVIGMLSANCQSNNFKKIESSKLDKEQMAFANDIGNKILIGQKTANYYMLTKEEATNAMIDGLNEEVQQKSYNQIRILFGEYESIAFEEAWRATNESNMIIYRFKGDFDATENQPEIRVVINKDGKLAGFFIKPWSKTL